MRSLRRLVAPLGVGTFVTILAAAMLLAAYGRWLEPARPGVVYPDGFYGYYDQSQYLNETRILSEGRLPADLNEYTYGLGYPVLGLPFYRLGFAGDPFAPVDVIAFGLVVAGTAVVAARFVGLRGGLTAALLVAAATPVLRLMTVPWNTTPVVAALMVTLVIVTTERPAGTIGAIVVGLSTGLAFASRYVDVVAFLAIVAWWLVTEPRDRRLRITAAFAVPALIVLSAVLYTHDHAFGSITTTPYAFHVRPDGTNDQSFGQYDLARVPRHGWEIAVTGSADGARGPRDPLLRISPFFALAPIGAIALVRRRRWRGLNAAVLGSSIVLTILYLAFVSGGGAGMIYDNLRYWQLWYPWWTIASVAGALVLWRAVRRIGSERGTVAGQ